MSSHLELDSGSESEDNVWKTWGNSCHINFEPHLHGHSAAITLDLVQSICSASIFMVRNSESPEISESLFMSCVSTIMQYETPIVAQFWLHFALCLASCALDFAFYIEYARRILDGTEVTQSFVKLAFSNVINLPKSRPDVAEMQKLFYDWPLELTRNSLAEYHYIVSGKPPPSKIECLYRFAKLQSDPRAQRLCLSSLMCARTCAALPNFDCELNETWSITKPTVDQIFAKTVPS